MSDWIKVDKETPSKDAVINIMEDCSTTNAEAFLAWFRLYCWLDGATADGTLNATRADIDMRAGLPGIADSLARSGWLEFRGRKCVVVNWLEHNGKSAKARALTARRVAKCKHMAKNPPPFPPPSR